MSIEIKIGKRDVTACARGVELMRIRRDRRGDWRRVWNNKVGTCKIPELELATDGTVHAWLEKEARRAVASELDGARNALRWDEGQIKSLRLALVAAEAEAAKSKERLARAERVAAALVADVLEWAP